MKKLIIATTAFFAFAGIARADAIEGMWKRPNGILVKISNCGGSYCVHAASGAHKGESAGTMRASGGGKYAGTVTELESGKSYTGKASISGDTLTMSGCVLGGLFCRSESWSRQ